MFLPLLYPECKVYVWIVLSLPMLLCFCCTSFFCSFSSLFKTLKIMRGKFGLNKNFSLIFRKLFLSYVRVLFLCFYFIGVFVISGARKDNTNKGKANTKGCEIKNYIHLCTDISCIIVLRLNKILKEVTTVEIQLWLRILIENGYTGIERKMTMNSKQCWR